MSVSEFPGRYVGIPFVERGSDFSGCHCWGLCSLVLRTECGIATPDYGETSADDLLAAARAFRDGVRNETWRKVGRDALQPFDCVLMRSLTDTGSRVENHAGIVAPFGAGIRILHVWKATAACLMPLDHPRLRTRIVAVYRHRNLA